MQRGRQLAQGTQPLTAASGLTPGVGHSAGGVPSCLPTCVAAASPTSSPVQWVPGPTSLGGSKACEGGGKSEPRGTCGSRGLGVAPKALVLRPALGCQELSEPCPEEDREEPGIHKLGQGVHVCASGFRCHLSLLPLKPAAQSLAHRRSLINALR